RSPSRPAARQEQKAGEAQRQTRTYPDRSDPAVWIGMWDRRIHQGPIGRFSNHLEQFRYVVYADFLVPLEPEILATTRIVFVDRGARRDREGELVRGRALVRVEFEELYLHYIVKVSGPIRRVHDDGALWEPPLLTALSDIDDENLRFGLR